MSHHPFKTDYKEVRKQCEKNSRITLHVVDDFLLGFAAGHHGLGKKMDQYFLKYRHITTKFEKATVELFKSQYIIHEVFKKGGLIEKFLRNPALDRFKGEERDYLLRQSEVPWRFSFAEITEEAAKDFYWMEDVFSGEEYLLFSTGTTGLLSSGNILLWFNLIGFNGSCWQSYGPIGAFQSFEPDDIFFFATEKNPEIEDEPAICNDIERDPLPYMMLLSGAAYPRTFHDKDEMILMMAEHDLEKLDTAGLKKTFKSEYDSGVYRLTHRKFGEPPHFAQVYFNENEKILLFSTMTETGFHELIRDFNSFGYSFPDIPYLRVRTQMVMTAGSILKKKIVLNEYEGMFHEDADPEVSAAVDHINAFVALVLPDINAGRMPDIEEAARKTGVDLNTARDMVNMIMGKRNEIPGAGAYQSKKKQGSPQSGKSPEEEQTPDRIRTIYRSARVIREMEPWNNLYESDLFGVKIPGSDRIYFISVMGANGEYTALAAYKSYVGLFRFLEFYDNSENMPAETLVTIPHLMLAFTDREEMDKEDLAAIKASGLSFRGKGMWPKLEEIAPGYLPAFPEGEALEDLSVILDQAVSVLSWAGDHPDLLYREGKDEDQILIRIPSGKPGKWLWRNHYEAPDPEKGIVHYKMTYRKDTCEEVSKLRVAPVNLLVDLIMLPTPVKPKGKKGYFPFVLLLVDKETGMVTGMNILAPEPDLTHLYQSVPQKLLEEISRLGSRPEKVEFRSELLFGLAEEPLKESWCMPVLVEKMPQMDEAIESLIEHLMR